MKDRLTQSHLMLSVFVNLITRLEEKNWFLLCPFCMWYCASVLPLVLGVRCGRYCGTPKLFNNYILTRIRNGITFYTCYHQSSIIQNPEFVLFATNVA